MHGNEQGSTLIFRETPNYPIYPPTQNSSCDIRHTDGNLICLAFREVVSQTVFQARPPAALPGTKKRPALQLKTRLAGETRIGGQQIIRDFCQF